MKQPFGPVGGEPGAESVEGNSAPESNPVTPSSAESATDGSATLSDEEPEHAAERENKSGRHRRLRLIVLVGVVAVAAVMTAFLLIRAHNEEPDTGATVYVTPPTPTISAVERSAGSPFFTALPDVAGPYALADWNPDPVLTRAGALESYTMRYSTGKQNADVVLTASQWSAEVEALAAAGIEKANPALAVTHGATSTAILSEQPTSGPVIVNGAEAGRFLVSDDGDKQTVTWTNGTAYFMVTGPAGATEGFFADFRF